MKVSSQISERFSIIKFEVDQVIGLEAQEFQDAILSTLDKDIFAVIIDLSRVKFISSWGIGMLIHGLATTKNSGKEYRIAGLTQNVMDVLKKVKIDKVLDIYNNVNAAKI
jgi:anti-sigma B factor antagonist